MQPRPIHTLWKPLALAALAAVVSACGSYQHVSSPSAPQSVPRIKDAPGLSGKPALHLPARIGVLGSGRSRASILDERALATLQQPGVAELLPISSHVDPATVHRMSDFMEQRARVVQSLRFLDLDLILFCDEASEIDDREHVPGLQYLTLGLVNPASRTVVASADAVLVDARTGFVYGALGEAGKGSAHTLTALEAEGFATLAERRARDNARRKALAGFPALWERIRTTHARG